MDGSNQFMKHINYGSEFVRVGEFQLRVYISEPCRHGVGRILDCASESRFRVAEMGAMISIPSISSSLRNWWSSSPFFLVPDTVSDVIVLISSLRLGESDLSLNARMSP